MNIVKFRIDFVTLQVREAQEAAGKLSEDLGSLEPDLVGVQKAEYDRLHMEHDKLIEALKSKEYELVKLNETTLFNQRAKQRYLDTLRRHLDGIAFNNLEKAKEIESLSKTLADSLIKTEMIEKDYSLTQQEALLLKEDLLNIKAKHKSDAEELIKQWEIEVKEKVSYVIAILLTLSISLVTKSGVIRHSISSYVSMHIALKRNRDTCT